MVERISIVEPVTQSVQGVTALLESLGRAVEPLPDVVDLGTAKLVLSGKKDCYYTVTEKGKCSCPSATYRPGSTCKHIRKHFAENKRRGQTMAETLAEHDRNLSKMPKSYQRLVRAAREEAESEEEPIPEEQQYKSICKPVGEEERAAKIADAKAKCEANRQQARDRQTGQKATRAEAEPTELISRGGFRPVLPEEGQSDFDRVS